MLCRVISIISLKQYARNPIEIIILIRGLYVLKVDFALHYSEVYRVNYKATTVSTIEPTIRIWWVYNLNLYRNQCILILLFVLLISNEMQMK